MKIILAIHTVDNRVYMGRTYSMRFADNFIPSLGLGYIAAVLVKMGHEVRIHNPVVPDKVERIADAVREWRPDILGLSLFTPHIRSVGSLLEILENTGRKPFTIAGGPHTSALPEETLRRYPIDIGVFGEGEETLSDIVKRLENGNGGLESIPGTVCRSNGIVIKNRARPLIQPLDSIPPPARDLMPPLKTHRPTPASIRKLPLAVMLTSRGCPYKCAFCDRAVFGASYRTHSPEYVLNEMREVTGKYGAREIRFFDDDLAIDRNRAAAIAEMIVSRGMKIPWTCNLSAKAADPELFRLFRKAGCWQVLFGLESGSDRILKKLKKHTSTSTSERAVRLALESGLRVRADFLVGTPGETIGEMWETVSFAIKLNVDFAHFNKFVPFPGTEIHNSLLKEGREFNYDENWSDTDISNIVYLPDGVDINEYRDFLRKAYITFYLRPSYILRRLSRIRTWTEFASHVKGMLALIFLK